MDCPHCVLCGSQLENCKERRVISGEKSCHVLPTAVRLLLDCVPGEMTISNSDIEAILSGTGELPYICKRPCYVQLEKIQRLESELNEVKEELKGKMKVVHRTELRRRAVAASDSEVEGPVTIPLAKRRLIISRGNAGASPSVTVS